MEKEVDADVIKATQESLGRFIKRPQLTEKLLKKPPFRFLHDIVTSVLKSSGFFEGLFDDTELISENVKDRDSKIAFLNKVIAVLGHTTGKTLGVKPSKIVAGQEADKTNELLQCLAYALDKKLSSRDAVAQLKGNIADSKVKKSTKSTKKESKLTSKSSENLVGKKESSQPVRKNDKNNTKTNSNVKTESKKESKSKKDALPKQAKSISEPIKKQSAPAPQQENYDPAKESPTSNDTGQETNNDDQILGSQTDSENANSQSTQQEYAIIPTGVLNHDSNDDKSNNDINSQKSTTENRLNDDDAPKKIDAIVKIDDSLQKENVINVPANPMAESDNDVIKPKTTNHDSPEQIQSENKLPISKTSLVKSSSEDSATSGRPGSVRPSSSRPAAPRPRDKHEPAGNDTLIAGKVNIIQESTKSDEEGDTSIIIVEPKLDEDVEESSFISSNYRGHLVQQILDSQTEFSQTSGKTEIELQIGSIKGREATNQDTEQLRFNIQALSRAANPLGKLLDHIQEDVEVMRQELQQWTKTYEDASNQLMKEKTANEESLLPMHTKIKQLDADIKEKNDKINDLKMEIRKNAARIDKLLDTGIGL